jgi:hypothetical protein
MECLSFLDELLTLCLQRVPFLVHDVLDLFEVLQFELKLLHLRLDELETNAYYTIASLITCRELTSTRLSLDLNKAQLGPNWAIWRLIIAQKGPTGPYQGSTMTNKAKKTLVKASPSSTRP